MPDTLILGSSWGALEHVLRKTLRMMRRAAAWTFEPLFGGGPDFRPAIGADWIHLRCLSE